MGRRKIQIAPIQDDRNRNVTFGKRRNGLFKKVGVMCKLTSISFAGRISATNPNLFRRELVQYLSCPDAAWKDALCGTLDATGDSHHILSLQSSPSPRSIILVRDVSNPHGHLD